MKNRIAAGYTLLATVLILLLLAFSGLSLITRRSDNILESQQTSEDIQMEIQRAYSSSESWESPEIVNTVDEIFAQNPRLELITVYSNSEGIVYHETRDSSGLRRIRSTSDQNWKAAPVYQIDSARENLITQSLTVPDQRGVHIDTLFYVFGRPDIYPTLKNLFFALLVLFLFTSILIIILPLLSSRDHESRAGEPGSTEPGEEDSVDLMGADSSSEESSPSVEDLESDLGFEFEESEEDPTDENEGFAASPDLADAPEEKPHPLDEPNTTDEPDSFNFDGIDADGIDFPEEEPENPMEEPVSADESLELPEEDLELPEEDLELPEEDLELPEEDLELPDEDLELPDEDLELPEEAIDFPDEELEDEPLTLETETEEPDEESLWEENETGEIDEEAEEAPSPSEEKPEMYSPRSGLGWENFMEERLNHELERAASFDQDLTLALIDSKKNLDDQDYKELADRVKKQFKFQDLAFEYGKNGFSIILSHHELDQSIQEMEKFLRDTEAKAGLSSRNGRILSGSRLKKEAERALQKARRKDEPKDIVAFRSDPDRYREFLAKGSSA